jgi:DNA (cytosine-5)-methyltransferase 1
MTHIDLFSGIGGFSLAASWVWPDHEVVCFCEQDEFCKKILNKHWPGVPIVEDVNDVGKILEIAQQQRLEESGSLGADLSVRSGEAEPSEEREEKEGDDETATNQPTATNVALLSAGVPCQPASVAGKQSGTRDDRWLWPQTFEVVRAVRPRWCLFENVRGLLSLEGGMVFKSLLSELEAIGYEVWSFIIPACAKNAPHRRDRVWIVANAGLRGFGKPENESKQQGGTNAVGSSQNVAHADLRHEPPRREWEKSISQEGEDRETVEPGSCRAGQSRGSERQSQRRLGFASSRLPKRLDNPWGPGWEDGTPRVITGQKDRVNRLKALGNSIVPQVVYEIMMAIKEVDENPSRNAERT